MICKRCGRSYPKRGGSYCGACYPYEAKGAMPPQGYVSKFEWATAQKRHGLKQSQCPKCLLWLFPQQFADHAHREEIMRDLNDEYNSANPSEAVDGYEYQAHGTGRIQMSADDFDCDLYAAIKLLAYHVKRLSHDWEVSMEIDAALADIERHMP